MTENDSTLEVDFCRKVRKRNSGTKFWTNNINLYMDSAEIAYKRNPEKVQFYKHSIMGGGKNPR